MTDNLNIKSISLFESIIKLKGGNFELLCKKRCLRHLLIIGIVLSFNELSFAQVTIKGVVKDSASQETLVGAVVSIDDTLGTTTDLNGTYKIKVQKGQHKIAYAFVTYKNKTAIITVMGDTVLNDIMLGSTSMGLQTVVISASMYEKNLAEENVSMDVIKPSAIENTGARELDDAINNVPGVTVTNGQASIRGGSGWAYGAGSRVLMLVDGLPELTADASDVIWDFLPIEETQQVEIIKGASSVLYGSSALDGVINVRTAFPTTTPVTTFSFFEGVYANPNVPDSVPWKGQQQPRFDGLTFMHRQQFNQLDLVCSGNLYSEQSYLQGAYDQRARISLNLRYRFKKINGLMVGARGSYMFQRNGTFLIWANDSAGIMRPFAGSGPSGTVVDGTFIRIAIDPYVNYNMADGSRITLQGRYFLSNNVDYGTNKGSIAELYYSEAKYQKDFKFHLTVTAGVTTTLNTVEAQLYGKHRGSNAAGYLQLEQKIGKLSITGGIRYETNKTDSIKGDSPLVFRAGANYKLAKATYLRASYGEGYRFPSIAEQFINTNIGGIPIFPNPAIQPEKGYSAELGINQAMKIGSWQGVADLAAFYSTYKNLIDFSFSYWVPPGASPVPFNIYYIGFKSVNIENAQISGLELTYNAIGKICGLPVELTAGVTAINPINLGTRDSVNNYEASHPNLSTAFKDSLKQTEILNYRSLYTAKVAFDISYKKFSLGGNFRYNSFIVNIDGIFLGKVVAPPLVINKEIIPGVKEFRDTHNKGDYIIDAHIAFQATTAINVSFIVKNLLNRTYIERPAYMEPPRNYTIQMGIKF
jgi:outer membrane cobalamin receptor